jgi:ankyrin repeat protein
MTTKPNRRISGTMALVLAALALTAVPATAQFSDSYNFLKAVKDADGKEAEKFINQPGSGSVIINTRDDGTGQTALHIVTERRDLTWLGYLLGKGAKPNVADKKGVTPLMLAVQLGWADGASLLLRLKADVDATNRAGETALIRAVQLRNTELVRLLLKAGANPDKQDSVAGYSARDYATQDGRGNAILALIESGGKADADAKKDGDKSGDLDFSGIK